MNAIANLSLLSKFRLIALVAGLTALLPCTMLLRDQWHQLQTVGAQRAALEPIGVLLQLARQTQQHRGISATVLSGQTAMAEERQKAEAAIEKTLADLGPRLDAVPDPRIKAEFARIAEAWRSVRSAVGGGSIAPAESFARHTALVTAELALVNQVRMAVGLDLLDDPGANRLQAGVLVWLPKLSEDLAQARGIGAGWLARQASTNDERIALASLRDAAQRDLASTRVVLSESMRDAPAIESAMAPALAAVERSVGEGTHLLDTQLVRAETPTLPAKEYFAAMTRVIDTQFALAEVAFASLGGELDAVQTQTRHTMAAVIGAVLLLGGFAAGLIVLIARCATVALGSAVRAAEAVASGDLTTPVPAGGNDEVGRLMKALAIMQPALARMVRSVRGNAEGLATSSAEIAQANQDMSSRTEQQASAIQQTAASMEQLGSTVRQTASHAGEVDRLAQEARTVATRGGESVGRVVSTMKEIDQRSAKIEDITRIIDGIAFQTNLLALNAAVEAARAGAQGRGFAVVAGEVRTLAQRSADAAREIKQLIADSVQSVRAGTEFVNQTAETMGVIMTSVSRVADIISEVSSASREQSQGVAQIGQAVSQMDLATQQNAALVEQTAAAAMSLRAQAADLVQAVSAFRLSSEEAMAA